MDTTKYISKLSGHALVFGGSGGIGEKVVEAIIANGASAVSFTYDRNKAKADALIEKLAAAGIKAYAAKVNLSETSEVDTFLENAVVETGEEISMVVHAVGISPNKHLRTQTLETTSDAYDDKGWREVFEVNVFGCFISCRSALLRMEKMGMTGSMVVITSTNGVNSQSSISTHYDCSKSAQIGVMFGLAKEFAQTAHVNGMAPGWINTPMNDTLPPEERAAEVKKIWIGEFAEPEKIAGPIAHFLSQTASFIRGQNIIADGGHD